MAFAPDLFSTSTDCPRVAVMSCAIMRAITSVGPPAAKPTRSFTGLLGEVCECAAAERAKQDYRDEKSFHNSIL